MLWSPFEGPLDCQCVLVEVDVFLFEPEDLATSRAERESDVDGCFDSLAANSV